MYIVQEIFCEYEKKDNPFHIIVYTSIFYSLNSLLLKLNLFISHSQIKLASPRNLMIFVRMKY